MAWLRTQWGRMPRVSVTSHMLTLIRQRYRLTYRRCFQEIEDRVRTVAAADVLLRRCHCGSRSAAAGSSTFSSPPSPPSVSGDTRVGSRQGAGSSSGSRGLTNPRPPHTWRNPPPVLVSAGPGVQGRMTYPVCHFAPRLMATGALLLTQRTAVASRGTGDSVSA